MTNIPRQYVDITDGGLKPFYGLGFPILTQGLSIQPSGLSIASISSPTIRTGNANINLTGTNFNRIGTLNIKVYVLKFMYIAVFMHLTLSQFFFVL